MTGDKLYYILFVLLFSLSLSSCYDETNPKAESCRYLLFPYMGIRVDGFRYVEPEVGKCYDCCRSPAWAMSDSALRACGKSRPDGEKHRFVGLDDLPGAKCR